MSATNAYACDGIDCPILTHRAPGTRFPADWPRLTLHVAGASTSGSFHNEACAQGWLTKHLGIAAAPAPLAPPSHSEKS